MSFHTTTAVADRALPLDDKHARPRLTSQQWKSGIAAWLGWLFDGLDMHLYTLVAAPFVMELVGAASVTDAAVKTKSSWIQAAFLIGWALGGGFFGRLGDLLGRSRALSLTILTYAMFTGLSAVAHTWWQLLIFRFLAALGIGGEWAVGSSLLSETWPRRWGPWIAAVLQTGVNLGVLIACLAASLMVHFPRRYVFLVGILPALLVFWIRKNVPEPEEWQRARAQSKANAQRSVGATSSMDELIEGHPRVSDLFRGQVRRTTLLTIVVCACSLTAWWAFMFWNPQQVRNLKDVQSWSVEDRDRLAYMSFFALIAVSIVGNFFAAILAKLFGYRRAIAFMCAGFFLSMFCAHIVPRDHYSYLLWTPWIGFFSGVFGLFTMYLPPLFPTLLRTTGAGFSYNIGRVAAAFGTIFFGLFSKVGEFRAALVYASFLFLPAMIVAWMLPDLVSKDEPSPEPAFAHASTGASVEVST
jgi:MFS family permease